MISLNVELEGIGAVAKRFQDLPALLDLAEQRAVGRSSLEVLELFRRNVAGPILHRRTGHYAQATNASPPVKSGEGWQSYVGVRKGDAEKYAQVHEGDPDTGAPVTIRPKKGRVLAVPIGAGIKPSGVPVYGSPKEVEDGFWLSRPGHPPLFLRSIEKRGKVNRLELLFVGLPSVTIPARKPLKTTQEESRSNVRAIVEEETRRALGG